MATQPMPIGKPIYFEGNIRSVIPDAYGVFYCDIESPSDLKHPLLQRRVKTPDGMRSIAGLGNWSGWITSVEMDKAIELGYKFNIIKGYRFKKDIVFKEFIEKLYSIRQSFPKSDPRNLIAKLIMNSLYGRLGLSSVHPKIEVLDISKQSDQDRMWEICESRLGLVNNITVGLNTTPTSDSKLEEKNKKAYEVSNVSKLDSKYWIVEYIELHNVSNNELQSSMFGADVNIAAASIITAGARVHMSQFKNNPNIRLYYSDTDSVVLNKELPSELVNDKLGSVKLECTIEYAAFLSPKVYALKTSDKKTIIKIKGLSKKTIDEAKLSFDDMFYLLAYGSEESFTQDKWYKNLQAGTLSVKQVAYQLRMTNN